MSGAFLPYQQRWIDETARFCIYEKSRRIGVTYAEAFRAVHTRMTSKRPYFYIAQNEETAVNFITYCKKFAEVINAALGEGYIDVDGAQRLILFMPNGSRIVGLTSSPEKARSNGGDVCIDEFAFHDHPEELYAAALPLTTWGDGLRVISTHNGSASYFSKMCREAGVMGFKHYKTTIFDAVDQGLADLIPGDHQKLLPDRAAMRAAWIEGVRKPLPPAIFEQEYCCVPLASGSRVVSGETYQRLALVKDCPSDLPDREYGRLFIGIDPGRTTAMTICWVVEEVFDPDEKDPDLAACWRTVAVKILKGVDLPTQQAALEPIIRHKAVESVIIDMGAQGRGLSDYFSMKYPTVKPVSLHQKFKAEIAENLRAMTHASRVALPDDPLLQEDVCALGFDGRTYDGRSSFGHCDAFWALALALNAAKQNRTHIFVA